jgi:hypothetical protein
MLVCLMIVWPYQNAHSLCVCACILMHSVVKWLKHIAKIELEMSVLDFTIWSDLQLKHVTGWNVSCLCSEALHWVCFITHCILRLCCYSYACKAEIALLVTGSKPVVSDTLDFLSQKNYCIKDSFSGKQKVCDSVKHANKILFCVLISVMMFIIASP